MYKLNQRAWMRRWAQDTQFYHIVQVNGDRLRFEAYTAAGKLFDAFEISKQRGRVNRVIDRIPRGGRNTVAAGFSLRPCRLLLG